MDAAEVAVVVGLVTMAAALVLLLVRRPTLVVSPLRSAVGVLGAVGAAVVAGITLEVWPPAAGIVVAAGLGMAAGLLLRHRQIVVVDGVLVAHEPRLPQSVTVVSSFVVIAGAALVDGDAVAVAGQVGLWAGAGLAAGHAACDLWARHLDPGLPAPSLRRCGACHDGLVERGRCALCGAEAPRHCVTCGARSDAAEVCPRCGTPRRSPGAGGEAPVVLCLECAHEGALTDRFCGACGVPLRAACAACGAPIGPDTGACVWCGRAPEPMSPAAQEAAAPI
jgi:hypothetical protein